MAETVTRVVMPVLVAVIWGSHGVRALVTGDGVSATALLACVAFTIAGTGLGIAGFTLFRRRATRPVDPEMSPLLLVLLGLANIGIGAGDGLFGTSGTLETLALAVCSAAGGFLLGAAVVLHGIQRQAPADHGTVSTTR
ncbi:MAG TPA: hypothetical protein VFZ64_16415 [Nocardioidaceae bacterium]